MVSVDTVYQRVLALANKEQRGYIPPVKFNLYANQAQMDIFEQYFYDRSQFGRRSGNQTMYADPIDILEEKIEIFHRAETLINTSSPINIFDLQNLTEDYYRLAKVITKGDALKGDTLGNNEHGNIVEKLTHSKFELVKRSSLIKPSLLRPVYYLKDTSIILEPDTIGSIEINYIRKPKNVVWQGTSVGDQLVYASGTDFELHISEETKLVMKILQLAAIEMKDPQLYRVASSEDIKNIQQEKQ